MDKKLISYLNKNKIIYKSHNHSATFTVKESLKIKNSIPRDVFHTKNLFLQNEKENFFLVCMDAHKKLNLPLLKQKLQAKKLFFASPEKLKEQLNITPGSVSIFSMIHAKQNVTLIVDQKVWQSEKVGFHPNLNTQTFELTHENLEKFYNLLNWEKLILQLK